MANVSTVLKSMACNLAAAHAGILVVENIVKRFEMPDGTLTAVDWVSWSVTPGEFLSVIGRPVAAIDTVQRHRRPRRLLPGKRGGGGRSSPWAAPRDRYVVKRRYRLAATALVCGSVERCLRSLRRADPDRPRRRGMARQGRGGARSAIGGRFAVSYAPTHPRDPQRGDRPADAIPDGDGV
jgi:hypothetical protein